mgnify:CR=1 FL=1
MSDTTTHLAERESVCPEPRTAPEGAPARVVGAAAPAREPLGSRFAHLFAFSGLSNLADGILYVGVPLYATTLTTSPGQVSLVSAALTAPWLVLGLLAGLLVDRHDRVRLLVAASLVRVLVFAGAALAASAGVLTMPVLLVLLLLLGSAEVLADGSSSALVPDVTPRSRLAAASSRLQGVQLVANHFLGAPLAGVLLALGAGWYFGAPAALVLAGVLVTARGLWGKVARVVRPQHDERGDARRELRLGLRFLRHHPVIRPLVLGGAAFNGLSNAYMAVLVLWVVGPSSAVGLAPEHYGLLAVGLAAGGLLGAVLAERIVGVGRERTVVAVTWGISAALLAVPALVPTVWAVAGAYALIGFFNTVGNTATSALRQRIVPSHLLGRVQGAAVTISYGAMPLGALLGGVVAELLGVRSLMLLVAACSVLVAAGTVRALSQRVIDLAGVLAERGEDEAILRAVPRRRSLLALAASVDGRPGAPWLEGPQLPR